MANTPDVSTCSDAERTAARLPIDPWRSLAVHFGMLLGVEDFRTVDAYHRGKHWLHTGWLHRAGVIWGLEPSLVDDQGELRLEAGLAIDPAGRELHLERAACIELGKWFARRAEQLFADGLEPEEDGRVRLDAHVRVRFVGCLERQVPAMVEPCDGAGRSTAYSRVYETIELELVPGLPEEPPPLYRRLRLLAGLDQARLDDGGDPIPEDQDILDARATILALPAAEQPPAFEEAFRSCAALDAAELDAPVDEEGDRALLPALDPAWLVLASLRELVLAPGPEPAGEDEAQTWVFDELGELDWRGRPTHVATRPLQDIVAAALMACCGGAGGPEPEPEAAGPRAIREELELASGQLNMGFDAPLAPGSEAGQLEINAFVPERGWLPVEVEGTRLIGGGRRLQARHAGVPEGATVVRIRFGHNEPPVIGEGGWPLAGADDDAPPSPAQAHRGRPFVHHLRRGES